MYQYALHLGAVLHVDRHPDGETLLPALVAEGHHPPDDAALHVEGHGPDPQLADVATADPVLVPQDDAAVASLTWSLSCFCHEKHV